VKVLGTWALALSLIGMALVGLLWFVGAKTAESGCLIVAEQRGYKSVAYDWSWAPLGTKCTFDNRVSETRLVW
jgi:hypothetical protein